MFRVLLGQGFTAEPPGKRVAFCRGTAAKHLFSLALLAVAILGAATVAGHAADPAGHADEPSARMLALVNDERAKAGQPPLTFDARLNAAACRHARDLARGGPLSHRGSDGSDLTERLSWSGYPFAMAAENLAAGVPTPDETVWLWSGSPGHRRNILTSGFRDAGIARVTGAGGQIWVLVFGTPRSVSGDKAQNAAQNRAKTADLRGDNALTCY